MMRQQIEARLISLKGEYDKGQTQLRQLELQLTSRRETMLRISGAVLVLEELLSSSASVTPAEEQSVPNGAHAVGQGRGEQKFESLTLDKKEN
jgi:hypothetical protein